MPRAPILLFLLLSASGCGPGAQASETTDDETTELGDTTERDDTTGETETTGSGGQVCEQSCDDPTEIADGLVQCDDFRINRVAAGSFNPTISAPACGGDETDLDCTTDADCDSSPHGRCIHGSTLEPTGDETTWCRCASSCGTDSDCPEGTVCVPPPALGSIDWPTCVIAKCKTNADCGECGECGVGLLGRCYDPLAQVRCRTSEDACASGWDCLAEGGDCYPGPGGRWTCQHTRCP